VALDDSMVGRTYPPTAPYEVGREKIREFAEAIGDDSPLYRDAQAAAERGYPDVIAPPTFPIVMTLLAGHQVTKDPALGIDYSRVVHGEQRFTYERPIHAGDVLTVTVTLDTLRTAGGNELIGTKAAVNTLDGELVLTADSLIVVRGKDAE
jgi:acyl dehydratase